MGCIVAKQLEKEFDYYLHHQSELVEKYDGKFVVIKNRQVIGVFDAEIEAIEKTAEGGGFIIGPGCTLFQDTPLANFNTVAKTVEKYGRY